MRYKKLIPYFALYFAQGYPLGFLAVILPLSGEKAGLSTPLIGFAMTAAMAPTFLKPFLAPLVDLSLSKRKRLLQIQLVMILSSAGLFLLNFSSLQVWIAAFIGAIIFGALTAYQDVSTDGLAIETLSGGITGPANAAMGLGMITGASFGNSIPVYLASQYGAGLSFLTVGAVAGFAFISAKIFIPERGFTVTEKIAIIRPSYFSLLISGFKSRNLKYAMVLMLIIGATSWSFGFLPLLFKEILGMSDSQVGGYMSFVTICSGFSGGFLGAAILGRNRDKQVVIVTAMLVIALQFLLGWTIYADRATSMFVGVLIGARQCTATMLFSGLYGFIMRFCSVKAGSTEFAFTMSISQVGTAFSASIGGLILEKGWVFLLFSEACAMTLVIPVLWLTIYKANQPYSQNKSYAFRVKRKTI